MKQHLKSTAVVNCLVIDDEPFARELIMEYIRQIDYLNPVAQCKSASEAAGILHKNRIDLMFIDIQMPNISGIEFVKALAHPPLIIFTTAHSEYALDGFDLAVVDFLLKPISFARFLKSVEKVESYMKIQPADNQITNNFFFIKCEHKIERIILTDILYIEAMANYVIINTHEKKFISHLTFSGIVEQLPTHLFVRIHKSYLVAIAAIETIDGAKVIIDNKRLPLSIHYKNDVMNKIDSMFIKRKEFKLIESAFC